jgi:hypothetical protein
MVFAPALASVEVFAEFEGLAATPEAAPPAFAHPAATSRQRADAADIMAARIMGASARIFRPQNEPFRSKIP